MQDGRPIVRALSGFPRESRVRRQGFFNDMRLRIPQGVSCKKAMVFNDMRLA